MLNLLSLTEYLNIYELLHLVGSQKLQQTINLDRLLIKQPSQPSYIYDGYSTTYLVFDTDNLAGLEDCLKATTQYPISIKSPVIILKIYQTGCHEIVDIIEHNQKYVDADMMAMDIHMFKAIHFVMDALSKGALKAYVMQNGYPYHYYAINQNFWHIKKHWYGLLADRPLHGDIVSSGDIACSGNVYFKKTEVDKYLSPDVTDQSKKTNHAQPFIDLDAYSTPWLQVLREVHDRHGKDELGYVSKVYLESFISEYVQEHNLDIAKSDIPLLAKFIRRPEQKAGKKYYAEQKRQQQPKS